LIFFLLIRTFIRKGEQSGTSKHMKGSDNKSKVSEKKISKKVGEYIDYEELDKLS
jgi:hypothetical protein